MICNGCGGVAGRDCFNPPECEWISRDIEARAAAEHAQGPMLQELSELRKRVAELEANQRDAAGESKEGK
jgi:hypothetical protein